MLHFCNGICFYTRARQRDRTSFFYFLKKIQWELTFEVLIIITGKIWITDKFGIQVIDHIEAFRLVIVMKIRIDRWGFLVNTVYYLTMSVIQIPPVCIQAFSIWKIHTDRRKFNFPNWKLRTHFWCQQHYWIRHGKTGLVPSTGMAVNQNTNNGKTPQGRPDPQSVTPWI